MRLERGSLGTILVLSGLLLAVAPATAELLSGPADAVLGRPVRTVLAADDDHTTVQITFPVVTAPQDWSTVGKVELRGVITEDMVSGSNEILEIEAEVDFNVAVADRVKPTWRVAAVQWYRQPQDPAVTVVSVGGPAVYRGVPLAPVSIHPTAGGGILAAVIVEITHPQTANLDKAQPDTRTVARAEAEPLPGNVVNPAVFRSLRAQAMTIAPRADKAPLTDVFALATNWVRLELDESGIYALTGAELEQMGVDLGAVDPLKLRLYKGGGLALDENPEVADDDQADRVGLNEVAILVEDGNDGEFDTDDRMIFYGLDVDVWQDRLDPSADRSAYYNHPHQAFGLYWLTWENLVTPTPLPGSPRRVPTDSAAPTGGATLTTHEARYHGEENGTYLGGYVRDNWVWDANILSAFRRSFDLAGVVEGAPAQWQMDVVGIYPSDYPRLTNYQVYGYFNDDIANAVPGAWMYKDQIGMERMRISGTTATLVRGSNRVNYVYDNYSELNSFHGFDSFDLMYRATLDKADYAGALTTVFWGADVTVPGTLVDVRYTLPDAGEWTIWDVSQPDSAVVLSGVQAAEPSPTLTIGLEREPGVDRHLVLFGDADLKSVTGGATVDVTPLRQVVPAADYIVVSPRAFSSAAHSLASMRSRHLPGVASPTGIAVDVEDIYANFSGGQKDWRAIRQFVRWCWVEYGQRVRWVCLLGDASRDYRNYSNQAPSSGLVDWIPTDLVTVFPWQEWYLIPQHYTAPYVADESIVALDAPPLDEPYDIPDIAIGRLPATSPAAAQQLVDRAILYAEDLPEGTWSNRVVFCADDLDQIGSSISQEVKHTRQAEALASHYVPLSIDMRKIFMLNYPKVGSYKPDARRALVSELGAGTSIFYYVGHGASDLLADEQVFRSEDIGRLTNGDRRFLFVAFSCDVGVFDNPTRQSMAEEFLTVGSGGAIGSITASWVSYITHNDSLSNGFYENLYPNRHVSDVQTVGEALIAAKATKRATSLAIKNGRRYNLLGDPALRIANPLDDVAFMAGSADSLLTGRVHRVQADLDAAGIVSGPGTTYDLTVEDSGVLELYYPTDSWLRPGNTVFRGQGSLSVEDQTIPFLAPLTLRTGDAGRIRCIINDGDEAHAAVSIVDVALAAAGTGGDVQGPVVNLGFDDGQIRVRPGETLTATLRDTSGVNILASNPANSVLLEFDRTGIYNNVSDDVFFEPGSYTRATLVTTLPQDLALGQHTVIMTAADMFGNVGSDTLSFQLEAASVAGLRSATVFPNPTPGPCRLVCDLSDAMDLQWDIYTVSGRCVRSIRTTIATPGPAVLDWDGRDGEGDNIANGAYLYVLRGRIEGDGHEIRETGQLVIMR